MAQESIERNTTDTMETLQQYVQGELNTLREKGVFRRPRVLETEQKATVIMDGREVITLSSNNYLGLTVHPKLKEAAIRAIEKYGVGSGAVRTIAGTMTLHRELEEKLARFKHAEAALTFQSGYTTNLGVISALMQEGDIIVSDSLTMPVSLTVLVSVKQAARSFLTKIYTVCVACWKSARMPIKSWL